MSELLGPAQQSLDKPKPLAQGLNVIIGFRQRVRQAFLQQWNPTRPVQEGPKSGRPGVRAELLVGELDLNGLMGALELNLRCHRLVSRACVR